MIYRKFLALGLALLLVAAPSWGAVGDPILEGVNNSLTFGDGTQATFTHTNNVSGTDTVVTYGSGVINVTTGALQEAGSNVLTVGDQNAGTDVTADLEEEGQIGGTAVTGTIADDQLLLGSGSGTAGYVSLPAGCNATTGKLHYTSATNTFSCETDNGGSSNPLSISSPEALTIATGAVTLTGAANTITFHTIDTEAAAASDDLDTMNCTAGSVHVIYAANGARTVVVNAPGAAAFSLDNAADRMELHCVATNTVEEISRANGGA